MIPEVILDTIRQSALVNPKLNIEGMEANTLIVFNFRANIDYVRMRVTNFSITEITKEILMDMFAKERIYPSHVYVVDMTSDSLSYHIIPVFIGGKYEYLRGLN